MKKNIFKISLILSLLLFSIGTTYADLVSDPSRHHNSLPTVKTSIADVVPVLIAAVIIIAIVCIVAFLILTLITVEKKVEKSEGLENKKESDE